MPTSAERITQLELELAEARAIYERENGIRFLIIMREISPEEKQRIMDSLTDRKERILFGLEAPEGAGRPAKSGGDLKCPICGKEGLTPRGLHLHTVRTHKGEQGREDTSKACLELKRAEMSRRSRRAEPS